MRRQVDRLARHRDRALLEVDDELAELDHGSPGGPAGAAPPAAGRGARRSRPASSRSRRRRRRARRSSRAPRRPPRAGSPAPSSTPQLAADVDPRAVGQHEVEDHRLRRPHRRRRRARPRPSRPSRPRSRRRAGSSAGPAGSAARRRRRARAGRRSCARLDRRACSATEARARTSRPGPPRLDRERGRRSPRRSRARSRGRGRRRAARRALAALERLEDPLALGGSDAGAVVDHPDRRLRRRPSTWTRTGSSGGEYLRAFSIRFTSARWIWCASTRRSGDSSGSVTSTRPAVGPELVERAGDELVELDQLLLRLGGAGLEAREVEQVADEVVEPVGGREDRREQLGAVGVVDREVRRARARRPRSRSPSAASAGRG